MNKLTDVVTRGFLYLILVTGAIVFLFPFYWMVINSTVTNAQMFVYPPRLYPGRVFLDNVRQLLEVIPFHLNYLNSLIVSTSRTVLMLFFCSLAGYAFAKHRFPGRKLLFALMLGTMMIPQGVSLIPWFVMMSFFGWVNSLKALIVPQIATAFGIFWMRQYIESSVPGELIDAARIDGCSEFGIYWRVVAPVILPGLGALAIITFLSTWEEYMGPLIILKQASKYTIPVALAVFQQGGGMPPNYVVMMTGVTLATAPILIVFLIASKQFISNLTAGALKF